MALSHSPSIVKNGLVLHYDAANQKSSALTNVEVLVVAGGGSGGGRSGGGGGGGGVIYNKNYAVTSGQSYTVTVGAGAPATSGTGEDGSNGGNSVFGTLVAVGGGGGGSDSASQGRPGGSGGGGKYGLNGGMGIVGQGYAGGYGTSGDWKAGGGGGAGGPGADGQSSTLKCGDGGPGIMSMITGSLTWYGGGGGGGSHDPSNGVSSQSAGGIGGGGAGGVPGSSSNGTNGTANTGGGGGGGSTISGNGGGGGAGGSGIVIVRYPGPQRAIGGTVTRVNNHTIHTFTTVGTTTFTPLPILNNGSTVSSVVDTSNTQAFGEAVGNPVYNSANSGYVTFNGSSNYIIFPENSQLNSASVTVEVWVKTNATTQNGFFFEKGQVNTQYALFQEGGNLVWRHTTSVGSLVATSASYINTSQFAQIVGTYTPGDRRLFVNGTQVAADTLNYALPTNANGYSIGVYGGYNGSRGYYFNGSIASVKVYNRSLSPAEVKQNFDALRGRYGI